ncbi:MAG: hypothetical protein AB7V48_10140 [Sedimentibacter sp.]
MVFIKEAMDWMQASFMMTMDLESSVACCLVQRLARGWIKMPMETL